MRVRGSLLSKITAAIAVTLLLLSCSSEKKEQDKVQQQIREMEAAIEKDTSVVIVTHRKDLGDEYRQIVCWGNVSVKEDEREKFVTWVKDEFGARAKFVGQYRTLPGDGGPGGRPDILFAIHTEDIDTFAIPRMDYKMRWWEDVLTDLRKRGALSVIPIEVRREFPAQW